MKNYTKLILFFLSSTICYADTFVSPSGSNTSPFDDLNKATHDIATAVATATAGSTVWVEGGHTYVSTGTVSLTKSVIVKGLGTERPIVDGNATVRPFIVNHSAAVLDGIIISNGYNSVNAGGVYLAAGTVRNCDIAYNMAPASGGMIINGNATATNCTIRFNVATNGLFGGVGLLHSGARLTGCVVEGNRAQGERGAGGGIITGAGIIDGCIFTNNATENNKSGGGIAVLVDGAIVRNSFFFDNQGREGGGLYMTANGLVTNCYFHGNVATLEGGAMRLDKGLVVNCEMRSNHAGASGGGAVMNRNAYGARLRNCLIVDNTASNYAGGVIAIVANGLLMENCTIANNNYYGVYDWVDGAISKTNCIVYFNTINWKNNTQWHSCCTIPAVTGTENRTDDPEFSDRTNGNYTLFQKSPCIDVGTTLDWMASAVDLAGSPRLAYGTFGGMGTKRVDLGAYEYVPPPPRTTLISLR